MKKLLGCLFAIIILLINVVPCFAASPSLSIGVSDYTVSPGQVVTVTVGLSSGSNLTALTFNVSYNTNEFEYVAGSATRGSLFSSGSIDASAGSVVCDNISTDAVTSGGTVATLKLKAVSTGGRISVSGMTATDADEAIVRVSGSSATLSCDHSKIIWEQKTAATCTKAGTETGTCVCGYTTTRQTEKAAHTYTSSVVKKPASCTETGIEVGTCTVCGASGVESRIPAKGHSYTEWVVKQPATADMVGIKERFCTSCGDVQNQTIPKLIEGIDPNEEPSSEEPENPTESTTEFEPIYTPEPSTSEVFEYETEPTTQSNGIFGDAVGSDIAIIAVIALSALVLVILVLYIVLIIRQKKK